MGDRWRWWLVHLIPPRLASWLVWRVPLGGWAPYVFGQAIGVRPERETSDDA